MARPISMLVSNKHWYRHEKTGGVYRAVYPNALWVGTYQPAVVYSNTQGGHLWVRSRDEFCDGRFQPTGNRCKGRVANPTMPVSAVRERDLEQLVVFFADAHVWVTTREEFDKYGPSVLRGTTREPLGAAFDGCPLGN